MATDSDYLDERVRPLFDLKHRAHAIDIVNGRAHKDIGALAASVERHAEALARDVQALSFALRRKPS